MTGTSEVCELLGPALEAFGFAAGEEGGGQVIFCAALDELANRLPGLPQVTAQSRSGCSLR